MLNKSSHTRNIRLLTFVFLVMTFSSCILVSDEYQVAQSQQQEESAQVIAPPRDMQDEAEKNVAAYIRKIFGESVSYKQYNFGKIYRLKHPLAVELDQLRELRALLPGMKDNYGNRLDSVQRIYDSLIIAKENEIKQKNAYSDYIISHVYTIKKNNNQGKGTVYEADFILDYQLGVKDVKVHTAVELGNDDFDWFYYYFQQFPIFNTGSYDRDRQLSAEIYDYYNSRLATIEGNKEELLKTALRVTRNINRNKAFDKDKIFAFVLEKKIIESGVYKDYRPVDYSEIEEIKVKNNETDSLIGYKAFHLFSYKNEKDEVVKKAIYTELDQYFVVAGILSVEPPYEKYFEDK